MKDTQISSEEWLSLNQFLYEIKKIDSTCISVYYPYGKGKDTISLMQETQRSEPLERIESKIVFGYKLSVTDRYQSNCLTN